MRPSTDVKPFIDERVSIRDQAFVIDPLRDPRWASLVKWHPSASIFHSQPWLQALHLTYGFEPIAVTTASPNESFVNGVVFCIVRSWLTGDRLVSLPFSDHCEPLVTHCEEFTVLTKLVERLRLDRRLRYVQIRSTNTNVNFDTCFSHTRSYSLHEIDLRPTLEELFRRLHKDCIQRKIQRAEREGLECTSGQGEALLRQFYDLLRVTRARHGIPPQPIEWFQNLVACMGSKLCIRIASKHGRPVAGIVTLRHNKQVVYKYGASDPAHTQLGGTAKLLWETIKQAKQDGAECLDLGRSDVDHLGLIRFKERWSAESSLLKSWEAPISMAIRHETRFTTPYAKEIFSRLPYRMQTMAGRLLYRHIG